MSLKAKQFKRHKAGVMNSTEKAYSIKLESMLQSGLIKMYLFESITLKIAKDCRYTPDFMVINDEDEIEFHECKGGFIMEDSFIKLKVAANIFPFRFFLCKYVKKQWEIKEMTNE